MLVYKIYGLVCNLGHVLKSSSHRAGLENIWFVGSHFETAVARGGILTTSTTSYIRMCESSKSPHALKHYSNLRFIQSSYIFLIVVQQ